MGCTSSSNSAHPVDNAVNKSANESANSIEEKSVDRATSPEEEGNKSKANSHQEYPHSESKCEQQPPMQQRQEEVIDDDRERSVTPPDGGDSIFHVSTEESDLMGVHIFDQYSNQYNSRDHAISTLTVDDLSESTRVALVPEDPRYSINITDSANNNNNNNNNKNIINSNSNSSNKATALKSIGNAESVTAVAVSSTLLADDSESTIAPLSINTTTAITAVSTTATTELPLTVKEPDQPATVVDSIASSFTATAAEENVAVESTGEFVEPSTPIATAVSSSTSSLLNPEAAAAAATEDEATAEVNTVAVKEEVAIEVGAAIGAAIEETATAVVTTAVAVPDMRKGYHWKQGHVMKNWKNRFFVLEAGKLTYYEKATMSYPFGLNKKGEMNLQDCSVERIKDYISIRRNDSGGNGSSSGSSSGSGSRISKRSSSGVATTTAVAVATTSSSSSGVVGDGDEGKEGHSELLLDVKHDNDRCDWLNCLQQHVQYANAMQSRL